MPIALVIALYLVFPALVIWLCYRFPSVNKVGPVVLCYVAGIALGNVDVLPEGADGVQETMSEVSVALALPLLLFSMDVRRWLRLARTALLSMLLAVISVSVVTLLGFFMVRHMVSDAWKVAGMLAGLYTGGTPNLAALKAALNVEPTQFIVVHTYDTVVSIIYIIFCVTVAQRVFSTFLPVFLASPCGDGAENSEKTEDIRAYADLVRGRTILSLSGGLVLSAGIVACSVLISGLVPEGSATTVTILCITSLAIIASMVGPVRRIARTFQLGMYIIYVFCFVVGSMASASLLVNVDFGVLVYIAFCIVGGMGLHALLCWPFGIDVDTFIITNVSAICSPPFVPVVAGALGNRAIVLSGLTTGIIGYAIGNYLGIGIAYLLRAMTG